ncbi:MAG: peptide chain release factor N(5)-glutamine methyltransferase [Bdellovibrionales bacterium]|nr:peptide chain release factor N(5)-glutamine methyltransferase [Bdellovibrionales bacterium]
MNTTIGQWLRSPSFSSYCDREYILQHVLNKSKSEIYLLWEQTLPKNQLKKCSDILFRHEKGEPLAYILGEVEFYSDTFFTDAKVFIPRPETEILVESVLNYYQNSYPRHFVDFGCGSGSIGLSLLKRWPKSQLLAVDTNRYALNLTLKNAGKFKLEKRIHLCFQNIIDLEIKHPIQLITANPPYIAKGDVGLQPAVEKYEPETALFSEWSGLKAICTWLDKACSILSKEGGNYFFEIGYNQYEEVKNILKNKHLVKYFTSYKDYQGYKRVIHCSVKRK